MALICLLQLETGSDWIFFFRFQIVFGCLRVWFRCFLIFQNYFRIFFQGEETEWLGMDTRFIFLHKRLNWYSKYNWRFFHDCVKTSLIIFQFGFQMGLRIDENCHIWSDFEMRSNKIFGSGSNQREQSIIKKKFKQNYHLLPKSKL